MLREFLTRLRFFVSRKRPVDLMRNCSFTSISPLRRISQRG